MALEECKLSYLKVYSERSNNSFVCSIPYIMLKRRLRLNKGKILDKKYTKIDSKETFIDRPPGVVYFLNGPSKRKILRALKYFQSL